MAAALLAGCAPGPSKQAETAALPKQEDIEAALTPSVAAWKAGRLEGFLSVYSDAPDAVFVTDAGMVRGKAAMADRYRKTYAFDDVARRGDLAIATTYFRPIDASHALAVMRFTLTPPTGPAITGYSTLVWRKESGGWKVIADHSS
ncbi:MAG: YybH family protein [Sphingomonadaceae bacterium]